MPRQMWIVLLSMLATSLCAFGQVTEWEVSPAPMVGPTTIGGAAGGTYTYGGGLDPLVGTNIGIYNIAGSGTVNSGASNSLTVIDGELNFTSGAENGGPGTWSWGAGAPGILITGCAMKGDGTVISGTIVAGVCTTPTNTLVSDDFTSVSIVPIIDGLGLEFGGVTGSINSQIASYFQVSAAFTTTPTGVDVPLANLPTIPPANLLDNTGAPFTATGATSVTSTGGTLTFIPTAVPEDASLFGSLGILAVGLLAVFGVARRLGLIKAVAF